MLPGVGNIYTKPQPPSSTNKKWDKKPTFLPTGLHKK